MSLSRQSVAFLAMGLVLGAGVSAAMWSLAADGAPEAAPAAVTEAGEGASVALPLEAAPRPVPSLPAVATPRGRAEPPESPGPPPVAPREPRAAEPPAPGAGEPPASSEGREPYETGDVSPAPRESPGAVAGEPPDRRPFEPPLHAPLESSEPVSAPAPRPAPEPPAMDRVLLAAGDRLPVVLEEPVASGTARVGERFDLVVEDAVPLGRDQVLGPGTPLRGVVVEAEGARRPQRPGRLLLAVDEILVDGRWHRIDALLTADGEAIRGRGSHREDARDIGIGAAAGTLLGAILGGEKGAVAGLVLGGAGVFLATRGEEVVLPAGTRLIAEVQEDLWLTLPRR